MAMFKIQDYNNLSLPGECSNPIEDWQASNDFIFWTVRLMMSHAIWMQLQWDVITSKQYFLI